jgi:hypothetical protein
MVTNFLAGFSLDSIHSDSPDFDVLPPHFTVSMVDVLVQNAMTDSVFR